MTNVQYVLQLNKFRLKYKQLNSEPNCVNKDFVMPPSEYCPLPLYGQVFK